MPDRPDDTQREIGELAERHRASKDRAQKAASQMEEDNERLRELIESYRRADDVLVWSRRS